jgi:threonine dehydrogenase-like Zn-dependent dehydrogenase
MLAEHHHAVPFERAVTHTFPLSEAEQAMQTALGADTAMKVVITP